jgi:hypothetical protein
MASTILADMPDVSSFKTANQFAAYVGVTPSHFQSGTSVKGKSRISKLGSKRIRNVLSKKGKCAKVIIVAIMRKPMHLFFGILKTNPFFNENLAFASCLKNSILAPSALWTTEKIFVPLYGFPPFATLHQTPSGICLSPRAFGHKRTVSSVHGIVGLYSNPEPYRKRRKTKIPGQEDRQSGP